MGAEWRGKERRQVVEVQQGPRATENEAQNNTVEPMHGGDDWRAEEVGVKEQKCSNECTAAQPRDRERLLQCGGWGGGGRGRMIHPTATRFWKFVGRPGSGHCGGSPLPPPAVQGLPPGRPP